MDLNPGKSRSVGTRLKKARFATFFGFFQLGAMIVIWSTSTTSLRAHMDWVGAQGDRNFGMLALSIGIGAAAGCYAIGPFIDRLGPRATTTFTLVICPLAYIPLTLVNGIYGAVCVGAVIGLSRGAQDTAVNAHGVQVERFYGRSIMSAFHAAYAAGGFVFGFAGSAFARHYTESPQMAYVSMGIALALLGLLSGRWMLGKHELLPPAEPKNDVHESTPKPRKSATTLLTILLMIGLGALLLCNQLSEGAVLDWGQEFVRRDFGTDAAFAAVTISAYSGALFVGRCVADWVAAKIGARMTVAGSGVLGACGTLVLLFGSSQWTALAGMALLGLGLAASPPLLLSAAGRKDPNNAGRNIGIVNALGYSGMLVGPAAITLIVDRFGISAMPVLSMVLLVLLAVAAPIIMRAVSKTTGDSQTSVRAGQPKESLNENGK